MTEVPPTEMRAPASDPSLGLDRASVWAQFITIIVVLAGAIYASRAGAQNVVPILGALAGLLVPAVARIVQLRKHRASTVQSRPTGAEGKRTDGGVRFWRVSLIWAFAYLIGFATPRLIDLVASPSADLSLAARATAEQETELRFSWNRIPPEKRVAVFVFSTASRQYFPQRFCGYSSATKGQRRCIVELGGAAERGHIVEVIAVMLDAVGVRDLEDRLHDPTFDGLRILPSQAVELRTISVVRGNN